MFAAPPAIEAEIFATIPEQFRRHGEISPWAKVQLHGAETPVFLEAPAFDSQGNLWVADIPWGRLFRIDPDGKVELGGEYDGWPTGMKFLADGRLLIADHKRGMMIFDPATGKAEPWFERYQLEPFKGCNDIAITKTGDLYFTDQGQSGWQSPTGRLYRVRAGSGQLELLLDNLPSPNGLVLNAAENALFLAVTRANAIWRVALHADGTVGKVGTFIQMSGGNGPDGVTIDQDDNLSVCHVGFGVVWLFSKLGEPMLRINSPVGIHTTNIAYGGPDMRSLFITESGSGTILTAPMPVAGREVHRASI
ncbi:MAG: SMP-30/gluconolactonase/LRE family protein [Novosphingobium sp.]|nr:SMP-30/gluconolactonase/LRE family protein [Novosphingobium sp.]